MDRKIKTNKSEETPPVIKGFKGFDKNLQCRGFQFKEGETFRHNGPASACNSGFHFCKNPLDVFVYYSPGESVFHEVEGGGQADHHNADSKVACTEIKIGAAITLPDFIGASIKFLFSRKYEESTSNHIIEDRSASSATGDRSASSATGYRSASSATGDASAAICTGQYSKAMAGKYGCIALAWWNEDAERLEMRCAETGCGGGSDGKLKSEVWYSVDSGGNIVEAE